MVRASFLNFKVFDCRFDLLVFFQMLFWPRHNQRPNCRFCFLAAQARDGGFSVHRFLTENTPTQCHQHNTFDASVSRSRINGPPLQIN